MQHYRYICGPWNAEYNFKEFPTRVQDPSRLIAWYSFFCQPPKWNTSRTVTFWILTFRVLEKAQNLFECYQMQSMIMAQRWMFLTLQKSLPHRSHIIKWWHWLLETEKLVTQVVLEYQQPVKKILERIRDFLGMILLPLFVLVPEDSNFLPQWYIAVCAKLSPDFLQTLKSWNM